MPATVTNPLPITETVTPTTQADVAEAVRRAGETQSAVYTIGGGTALDFGLVPRQSGIALGTTELRRVIDYPARDMTITVEAGITMAELARTLATERQRLPIDAPESDKATIGGIIATNFNGPRRYGCGTVRDYVIGITAVDGRGVTFHGGGRVVKNVAGYDFCKLLTGSLGTLAVTTQVTLKLKPIPETSALVACDVASAVEAETLLAALVTSKTTPTAIELLAGPAGKDVSPSSWARLVVGLEGTAAEVAWMIGQLNDEWKALGISQTHTFRDDAASPTWERLVDFSASGEHPLVLKINVRPSAVCGMIDLLRGIDPGCSIQAHAGNGIIVARFAEFSAADASKVLIAQVQPAAIAAGGQAIVWSSTSMGDLTRQAVWGPGGDETPLMRAVKQQFDPHNLLNPGRFVYGT